MSYFQVLVLVQAIQEAAKIIASGEGSFSKTSDTLRTLRGMMFPELAEDTESRAQKAQEIMAQELSKGPLKIQRLDYETKKKKRR